MKRRRLVESGFGLEGYEAPDEVWHARSKELEGARKQEQIDGVAERKMIESAPPHMPVPEESAVTMNATGIFSGSTIERLKGYTTNGKSTTGEPSGPLVGYGSDEDSD